MLHQQRDHTWTPSAGRRQRSRQAARVASSSHGTNGSQIRSTSALLIRDASAATTARAAAPDEQAHDAR